MSHEKISVKFWQFINSLPLDFHPSSAAAPQSPSSEKSGAPKGKDITSTCLQCQTERIPDEPPFDQLAPLEQWQSHVPLPDSAWASGSDPALDAECFE